jgi:hypothetical protein
LPVFAGYSQSISNPIYDPYDLDIKYKDKVEGYSGKQKIPLKKLRKILLQLKVLIFKMFELLLPKINAKNLGICKILI